NPLGLPLHARELTADAPGVVVLGRAEPIGQRPQEQFHQHEHGDDPDGQGDPTEGTNDFVTHRYASSAREADPASRFRTAEGIGPDRSSPPIILKGLPTSVYQAVLHSLQRPRP